MYLKILSLFLLSLLLKVKAAHEGGIPNNPAFDPQFYKDQLDPELCAEQLDHIKRNNLFLRLQFLESGPRIPRSILTGNTLDLGLYHQCIGINEDIGNSVVEGKYCMIDVPLDQSFELPEVPDWIDSLPDWIDSLPDWIDSLPDWIDSLPNWMNFDPRKLRMGKDAREQVKEFKTAEAFRRGVAMLDGGAHRSSSINISNVNFKLAVCVPKTCTVQEGLNGLLYNLTTLGFQYEETSCRLKNDKPWVPADYVAIVIFSIIGFITLLSTSYDLWHLFFLKTNPKSINTLCRSFSLYTNTKRLTTFTKSPGAIECIDGIRALAMMWVIIGHTFFTLPPYVNLLDAFQWLTSIASLWITAGPISVDTFFMLSGLLLVYTTCGKLTSMKLLKNLHLFYLNRLLRMFPLLAAVVLVQASIFHRVADGPLWDSVVYNTNTCRAYWWTVMLYVQNYVNEHGMCLGHTWYLAIDIQLHIISPLMLFWVLSGNKKSAWIALAAGLLAFLTSSTIYNYIQGFPSSTVTGSDPEVNANYMSNYYLNTLTRASPFFVGMIFGYLLHLWRNRKVEMSKGLVALLWISALTLTTSTFYANHPIKQLDWDSTILDGIINSFMRPAWAAGLGLIIFACVHGYAGPIDWFLSLEIWKLPSRLSYGMYLFHFPIQYVMNGTALAPIYFTPIDTFYDYKHIMLTTTFPAGVVRDILKPQNIHVSPVVPEISFMSLCLIEIGNRRQLAIAALDGFSRVYMFVGQFAIAFMVSFVVTLTIDSPCSTLIKLALGGGAKPQKTEDKNGDLKRDKINGAITSNGIKRDTDQYIEKL